MSSSLVQDREHHNGPDKADDVRSLAQRSLDRLVAPSSRRRAYDSASSLAAARPVLFSFALSQLLFSFLPLLLFAAFAASTVIFALGAAIFFALFWIGIALLLLVPALLVVSSIALLVWGWALGSFLIARWLYAHAPVAANGRVDVDVAGRHMDVVKNENGVDGNISDKH
ncbi:promethin domain-containing protein [Hirsutella rhossiliensis]|uniref:Promethin domain-containing protein n=1 Tax=Hirsutella rhossiliensis TaxID=111463 RepID=A0A9P8MYP6_9HYPO|nr:promethin domain-containing protein [Hirsutella rhossiliensis]KAH0963690.1 promethin domain-containing protein [Hirsutella rhossiliensis]